MAFHEPELDALKQAWQSMDRQLRRQNALHLADLHERRLGRIRASLRPLLLGQLLQMLFGVAVVLYGVWLWRHFPSITPVLVCGIVAHAYGVAVVIASGVVLGGIGRIDRSLPVLELQRRLARLRRAHVIGGAVVGLPWWVLWMQPVIVVAALGRAQAGLPPQLPAWIWITLAACMLGLFATLAFDRWLRRPGREALAARVRDAAAGGALRRAQAELDALKRFGEE